MQRSESLFVDSLFRLLRMIDDEYQTLTYWRVHAVVEKKKERIWLDTRMMLTNRSIVHSVDVYLIAFPFIVVSSSSTMATHGRCVIRSRLLIINEANDRQKRVSNQPTVFDFSLE